MKLGLLTDALGEYGLEELLEIAGKAGFEALEISCGNWSKRCRAPHIHVEQLLESTEQCEKYLSALKSYGLEISALNCSGNQLAPGKEGEIHREVVKNTIRLAGRLHVETIVMMSGLPGGGAGDAYPSWVTMSWPPVCKEILDYQWNEVVIPYWQWLADYALAHGVKRIALENYANNVVYNVRSLLKLRAAVGDIIGMNLDPSHLLWMGGDPIAAVKALAREGALYYVHAKDMRREENIFGVNGCCDPTDNSKYARRAWNYVTVGYGQEEGWWKKFIAVLKLTGYDGVISLEHEDVSMGALEGVRKAAGVLKRCIY